MLMLVLMLMLIYNLKLMVMLLPRHNLMLTVMLQPRHQPTAFAQTSASSEPGTASSVDGRVCAAAFA